MNPSFIRQSWWKRGFGLELLAAFVTGVVLMQFIYLDPRGYRDDRMGVPEYDSWYHLKMAELLPEIGFVREFPWLQHVYFRQTGREFVSHHAGFHVYLAPFVWLSRTLTGDVAAGGRWAIGVTFGLSLMLFHLLLMVGRVPWRWMWLLAFLLLPTDFFLRHSYIRAISPSLVLMLALLLALFRRRPIWAAIAVMIYNLLYLGAVIYSPVIVGAYVFASWVGPGEDRRFEWKLAAFTLAGWCAGVLLYPYREGMFEFLYLQVLGSGLSPDIAVGAEWSSYGNVWEFAVQQCGPLLAVWAASVVLRFRFGPRMSAQDTTLLLLNFALLFLTLKAQRFIEYWPPVCLLNAAYLAGPVLVRGAAWAKKKSAQLKSWAVHLLSSLGLVSFVAVSAAAVWDARSTLVGGAMVRDWALWVALGSLFLMSLFVQHAGAEPMDGTQLHRGRRAVGMLLGGLAFIAAGTWLFTAVLHAKTVSPSSLVRAEWPLATAVSFIVLLSILVAFRRPARTPTSSAVASPSDLIASTSTIGAPTSREAGTTDALRRMPPWLRGMGLVTAALAVLALTTALSGGRLSHAQSASNCGYDLPAIRNVMAHLKSVSQPGDVVFTDDWDCFPVYFYHNSYNYYIVGLDPKFTQWREPELWARYVKISRGEIRDPNVTVALPDDRGGYTNQTIQVRIEDIRDRFGCKFVLVDRDHPGLARQLAERPDFAELIFPPAEYAVAKDAPYLLFRVRDDQRNPTDASIETSAEARPPHQPGRRFRMAIQPRTAE
ncbi:MAG: hypothetical protein IT449_01340 [Phycisphaerales bacterium]|nr:hypothetical protein [Phycisphaerales bacterium]